KIRIKPQPASLQFAEVKTPTVRGDIFVAFDNRQNDRFVLTVEIPANTVAEVWLPKIAAKYTLLVDNRPSKGVEKGDFILVNVGSGRHHFSVAIR
ncbi:MAG: alpha-L-rhamnosidase, partial [Bacteroidales bacterium]|nr:alpha-L-rhamnosidase [Bacteroidales bacterium]